MPVLGGLSSGLRRTLIGLVMATSACAGSTGGKVQSPAAPPSPATPPPALTTSERAAYEKRPATAAQRERLERECDLPKPPDGASSARVMLPEWRFLIQLKAVSRGGGKSSMIGQGLPYGGLHSADFCWTPATLEALRKDVAALSHAFGLLVPPRVSISEDYPQSVPVIREQDSLYRLPSGPYAVTRSRDGERLDAAIARLRREGLNVAASGMALSWRGYLYAPLAR